MREEARTDDEDALVTKYPEPLSDRQQGVRIIRRQGKLQHRDICLRVHDGDRHPGAVIKSTAWMLVHLSYISEGAGDRACQRCCVGRPVLPSVIPLVEPTEVIHQRCIRSGG